ncbi:DNA mismatch repair endonuclease MutL [Paenibacillus radicis (ex Gao et al. 2016)]|uniref:DNA mismatch repair protein MutL n=1 Tax=Paenibacillus radicis (ex Gao et al. 2016) TaxID=1737354 RepID=A0A917MAE8_9BACL|nr:DNA mismatch repair endonuclease MutL [Paenibacillus radicis (ex Gao et al. 2016)]GGG87916.1 DNA mismatch repair protein MutL [Paenibacillus radicis (ex Gao et al. 2016)]
MGKIKVLDEQLANQIAAGEVVERPASVIKELVENAVDAGSSQIDITVEEGGLTLIRVTDNGSGIEAGDIATAFQRHATSKIATSSDLFRIASLGFRGEALPSIAAVSRLSAVSSTETTGLAHRLVIEGGEIKTDEPANAPQGTDMTVRDLFFNTPARLKYMKAIQTELGHISDYIYRIALAHPGIAFTLKHNNNTLLRTLGTGDRLQVIAAVYGTNTAKSMLSIEGENPDYDLRGYISKPELTRANRNGMTVIVNGRYIRSHAVNQAILQAYHTLLPINRFPLVVLELGMHPSLLDVNVHPSKMEVRFSKEAELRALIEQSVKAALGQYRYIPGPEASMKQERSKPLFVQDAIAFHRPLPEDAASAPGTLPVGQQFESQAQPQSELQTQPQSHSQPQWQPSRPVAESGNGSGIGRSSYTGYKEQSESVPSDATERLYRPAEPQNSALRERQAFWDQAAPAVQPAAGSHAADSWMEEAHIESIAAPSGADPTAQSASVSSRADPTAQVTSVPYESDPTAQAASVPYGSDPTAQAPSAPYGAGSTPDTAIAGIASREATGTASPAFPELYWIGQLHGTYIVAQAEDGLYLIDQHAAHERINYEYYYMKFGNPAAASQQLLVPLTLEFTPNDAQQLRTMTDLFAEAGVEIEPFGQQTFLVRSYPEWLPDGEEQSIIEEMAELLLSERKSIDVAKLREKAAIMCSCKASIKANDRKTREEGEALLARLAACNQPYTCPHGRPIIVHMSTYQLEKMFKRVMS